MKRAILMDIVESLGAGIGLGIIVALIAAVAHITWSYP
jgi:hypothetical protein